MSDVKAVLAGWQDRSGSDPKPWRTMMTNGERWASRADAPETKALVYDPRPEYGSSPLLAAVKAVLAVHRHSTWDEYHDEDRCMADHNLWPCPTIRAVTAALGAEPESGSER